MTVQKLSAAALFGACAFALAACSSGSRGTGGSLPIDLSVQSYSANYANMPPNVGDIATQPMIVEANLGSVDAGAHTVGCYAAAGTMTPTVNDFRFDQFVVSNLPGGMMITLMPAMGPGMPANQVGLRPLPAANGVSGSAISLAAIADDVNAISETDETNNALADGGGPYTFAAATGIDLTPASFIGVSAASIAFNSSFTVSLAVANVGAMAAGGFDIDLILSDVNGNTGRPVMTANNLFPVAGQAAGTASMVSIPCIQDPNLGMTPGMMQTTLTAGSYQLTVVLDAGAAPGQVMEADEANNMISEFVTIQ